MTTHDRDKVIAAAKEAEFDIEEADEYHKSSQVIDSGNQWITCKIETIYAIAHEAGRQAEREECAKVCESIDSLASSNPPILCAKAIRARGDGK